MQLMIKVVEERLDFLRCTSHLRDGRLLLLVLRMVVLVVLSGVLKIHKGEVVGEDEKSPAVSQ